VSEIPERWRKRSRGERRWGGKDVRRDGGPFLGPRLGLLLV
jgi:hypothetical protein